MSSPNYQMENPLKLADYKFKSYHKAKGISSLFAFVFSIVIYISIFYIFGLSPSAFRNTNLFVISNILILIIAADCISSSSSSKDQNRDIYDEYALHSQASWGNTTTTTTAAVEAAASSLEIVTNIISKEEEISFLELEEKEEDVADEKNNKIPERALEVAKIEPETDSTMKMMEPKPKPKPKPIRRSRSDEVKSVTYNDKKSNLQRSMTKKQDEPVAKENEFSTMSDEELNRRVEEFIQKFNRQIRLQDVRNSQVLEYE
ncbi:hypothetical protein PTKIN_Ptkin18bG0095600 [Pterospermum kingtungense]